MKVEEPVSASGLEPGIIPRKGDLGPGILPAGKPADKLSSRAWFFL
jgi:hypothetical protein